MKLARDVRAFFVCARVREARKRGWEISIFLGFLGIVGVGGVVLIFLGNLSFLGFKRDGDMNLYYIKWKILPKMYFLLCKKRKICSTEIFSTPPNGTVRPHLE